MSTADIALAEDFPVADRAQWLTLVERALDGAGLEDWLVSRTASGLEIRPLYAAAETPESLRRRTPDPQRPWDLRTRIGHPDPRLANAELLADLAGGASSILLALDPDANQGAAIGSAQALAQALDGVLLELAPVALDAGFLGPAAADWLAAAAKASPLARLEFQLDPLSALAMTGRSPGPIESHLIRAATTAVRLGEPYPQAGLFLASGRAAHEAGGSEALELGLAAASAVAYAKALARAGLAAPQALRRITLGLCADADYGVTVAKLRAARRIWDRIAGAWDCDAPARIEATSSRRMLTRADPWSNMLRLTAAGLGAALGGADTIILGNFTDALGLPTAFARRQSRNIQLVLMEEAHLGRVADPLAGSGYVEGLTDHLARAGWSAFQAIERQGGVVAALRAGWVAQEAAQTLAARRTVIAEGRAPILGVTAYPDAAQQTPAVETPDRAALAIPGPSARLPGPDTRIAPLTPQRLAEPFEAPHP
jgi:methylmalonyl-CoA mutase